MFIIDTNSCLNHAYTNIVIEEACSMKFEIDGRKIIILVNTSKIFMQTIQYIQEWFYIKKKYELLVSNSYCRLNNFTYILRNFFSKSNIHCHVSYFGEFSVSSLSLRFCWWDKTFLSVWMSVIHVPLRISMLGCEKRRRKKALGLP